jgi:fermentation-respiration switch protein FrsA (DUF1100 family)
MVTESTKKVEVTPTPIKERTLDKYTIENLGKRTYKSQVVVDEPVATESAYTSYRFHFDSDGKRVNGMSNVPNKGQDWPTVVMLRGYWPVESYKPGDGTRRAAAVLAENGFRTLAPDGLGYGGSDNPSTDVFEERFQAYTTVLNLMSGVDGEIGVWGHSNGGQQALTAAAIINKKLPVVVWAPVTARFPYSILYFMDEAPDGGRALREKLAVFESEYNADLYSVTKYWEKIVGPVQMHQGTADPDVPVKWTRTANQELKAEYFEYGGADHNLQPNQNWVVAVDRTVNFFKNYLKQQE